MGRLPNPSGGMQRPLPTTVSSSRRISKLLCWCWYAFLTINQASLGVFSTRTPGASLTSCLQRPLFLKTSNMLVFILVKRGNWGRPLGPSALKANTKVKETYTLATVLDPGWIFHTCHCRPFLELLRSPRQGKCPPNGIQEESGPTLETVPLRLVCNMDLEA